MSIQTLQDYTFVSRYARYDADKKRRETWDEAVDRVMGMHLRRYPQVEEEIKWAFDKVREKRVLGSQRALQFGGQPIEKKHARMYNCTASYCDRLRFFQEALWWLLCGSGVGFSVQKHHVAKLPNFAHSAENRKLLPKRTYEIPDSIEGWADALGVLLSSYFGTEGNSIFPEYNDVRVVFDYTQIRPAGAVLNSSSGKAPGPQPLNRALEKTRSLLERCLANEQTRLRPIDAYDIVMYASDAVLSGGVRRSATLCLFSFDDEEMMSAKVGNWFYENPQRARSNNSVLLLRDDTTREQFSSMIQKVKEFGEPGFIWSDSTEVVFNPCVEVALYPVDEQTGKTGWETCNLTEINGGKLETVEDFEIAARAAAVIGTLQAGYTDFEYLGEVTERIVRRESLLGVSMTGVMDNPAIALNPEIQQKMAKLVLAVNEELSKKIGINPTARATCLKPAGSTSCMLGTSSGIHPHHWNKYLRRVQTNKMELPLQHFQKVNPLSVDNSVWSANKTDAVITFCIESPKEASTKKDLSAVELLTAVKTTQQNWVIPGTRKERCVKPWLNHNVSNTCFSGKTRFITDCGLRKFTDFKDGGEINVLNYRGDFVPGLVKHFGKQEIWELTLSDGKSTTTIETTKNHVWLICGKNTKHKEQPKSDRSLINHHAGFKMVNTYNLSKLTNSFQIPKVHSRVPNRKIIHEAFCHGFVFGDGSKHYKNELSKTHVCIYDECKKEIADYFTQHIQGCSRVDHDDFIYIGKLNPRWKEIPKTTDCDYIFSFIAGWFAADGSIASAEDNQRAIRLCSANKESLEWAIEVCQIAGIGTSGYIRENVQKSGYKIGETYYSITFVKSTLSDEFFVNHKDKYLNWLGQKNRVQSPKYFSIVDCRGTGRVEDVYCVIEPETSTFVLEHNILTHNCNVRENEWEQVRDFIYDNRKYFAGVSLLPDTGDLDYQQAPMVHILEADELVEKYGPGSILASGLIVDGLAAFKDNLWIACDAAMGLGQHDSIMAWDETNPAPNLQDNFVDRGIWSVNKECNDRKKDWIRRARQFAERYFDGDIRKMCYCLKQVSLWKTWIDLKRVYKPVDYTECVEEEDNTTLVQEVACSGGKCDM